MTFRRAALGAAVLCLAAAASLRAQQSEIRIAGDDRSPAAALARDILTRGAYLRFDRDTVLDSTFVAPGDVVVFDADVRLEGRIEGRVAVIGGSLFIRPRAVVRGDIALLGGEVYPSALATMSGRILETRPGAQVAVAGNPGAVDSADYTATIIEPVRPAVIGFYPRPIPGYDRVNGLSITAGGRILPTRDHEGPRIDFSATYRGENPDPLGGEVRATIPLGMQNVKLVGSASRATHTNDAWQRGDLSNAISVFGTGRDYRDYWDADQLRLMIDRPVGKSLISGESWLSPRAGVLWSRDRSLRAKHVFSLWDSRDKDRINPSVADSTILSAFAGAGLTMIGRVSSFTGDVQVERTLGGSDASFTQVVGDATYNTTAFRTHTLRLYFRGMAPLDGDAPRQRYAILGGASTLPTLRIADYRGDHLVFVDGRYGIPVPVLLPFVGAPTFQLLYATGAAWTGDESPRWTQNVGTGLLFSLVGVAVYVDPSDPKPRLAVSASIPSF